MQTCLLYRLNVTILPYNTTCICPYVSIIVSASINLRDPLLAAVRISYFIYDLCTYNVFLNGRRNFGEYGK